MPIRRDEDWVQIATLDDQDRIQFTDEYRELMGELGWEAKAFIGHLLGLWYDPFEHMLDYGSGEAEVTEDQPGTFDRNDLTEPQDVVEYWAKSWSENDNDHDPPHKAGTGLGLDVGWYRDVLRAKLVSLRLPRRLLEEYKAKLLEQSRELEAYWRERQRSTIGPAYPRGWDEHRVREVLDHYECQTDDEAATEHEKTLRDAAGRSADGSGGTGG